MKVGDKGLKMGNGETESKDVEKVDRAYPHSWVKRMKTERHGRGSGRDIYS